MFSIRKQVGAAVIAGVLLVSMGSVQAALADAIPSGTITITPTSGTSTQQYLLNSLVSNATCPVGFRGGAVTTAFQNGVDQNIASNRSPSTSNTGNVYGFFGLDGAAINIVRNGTDPNNYLSSKRLEQLATPLTAGSWELRVYCVADVFTYNLPTEKWFSLAMTMDAAGNWAVDVPAAPAVGTTVSFTAGTTANAGEVNLSAIVKKASDSTTATAAVGNVVFKEGTTTVGTVAVASGLASALLTGVSNGAHTYTAEFVSGNTSYSGSTSGAATVYPGGQTGSTNITVTIPAGVGTLTLTGVTSNIPMGTAVLAGGTLNAQGTLNAVVTDTRQLEYPGWSLTGVVSDFTSGTGPSVKTLSGKYLGWTPSITGDAAGDAAGLPVLPATPAAGLGLTAPTSILATGVPNETGTITNASAVLQLKAPSNTRAGAYAAILTLTLI